MIGAVAEKCGVATLADRPLKIDVRREANGVVVTPTGSCTMDVAAQFTQCLEALASEPIDRLVVDLSGLDFIESCGLGGLVSAFVRCRRRNSQLRLVAPRPPIYDILRLTRLSEILPISDCVDSALRESD